MADHPVSEPEEWRPVPGHPGYEASNLGRVRSLDRYVIQRVFRAGVILKASPGRRYQRVSLGPKARWASTHWIICRTFHGPRPSRYHQAGHWNGDAHDNRSSNLRWVTPKQNKADEIRHQTRRNGAENGNSKLTEANIQTIREMYARGLTLRAIGRRFDTTGENIGFIVKRRTWRHIP